MRGVELRPAGDRRHGNGRILPPGLRTAYVDALIAAWEGAIQAEDVDGDRVLADESLEASRALGLREVLDARTMVGMALEYGATRRTRRRHVPPGLGRGVASRPADGGDRRRLSPRLRAGRRLGAGRRAPHQPGRPSGWPPGRAITAVSATGPAW